MSNKVIDAIEKEYELYKYDAVESIISDTVLDIIEDWLPSLEFVKKYELDEYRVLQKEPTQEVKINGKNAKLFQFIPCKLPLNIINYFDDEYVEIYFMDDLVFKASYGSRIVNYDLPDGSSDCCLVRSLNEPDIHIKNTWEEYFWMLKVCYDYEENMYDKELKIEREHAKQKQLETKFSDLKIE